MSVVVSFTNEERQEITKKVIPDLFMDLKNIQDEELFKYTIDLFDGKFNIDRNLSILDIYFDKIQEVLLQYDSVYKRMSIFNSVYKTSKRFGLDFPLFPDIAKRLFDHKYLAEDDYNLYDPNSISTPDDIDTIRQNILEASQYDWILEGYVGNWRYLGKCKTCGEDIKLPYDRFYYYYNKVKYEKNYHYPCHCDHCRKLKRQKKIIKLVHRNPDGSPLTPKQHKTIKKNNKFLKNYLGMMTFLREKRNQSI